MFDPAVLLNLEVAVPPQPPIAAQERVWQSPAGAAVERVASKLTAAFNEQADGWLGQLTAIMKRFESDRLDRTWTPDEDARLERLIDEYEAHAELRAIASARLEKRIRREVKAMFKVEPSVAAAARTAGNSIIATDKRIVEGLLDYALFLRAFRAEGSPDGDRGAVFDDVEALKRHLDALAA